MTEWALQFNNTPAAGQPESRHRVLPNERQPSSTTLIPSNLPGKLRRALPRNETIELLVNTYFDRVHWFVLVFHQDDFKHRLKAFVNDKLALPMTRIETTGFLSTLLAVLCVVLECLGPHRTSLLEQQGVQRHELQVKIEEVLNECFLDIVSLATIQSAQSCVLLSVYYLYQERGLRERDVIWLYAGGRDRVLLAEADAMLEGGFGQGGVKKGMINCFGERG